MTDPNGRILRDGFEANAPRTATEFADYFKQSQLGKRNSEDITSYNDHCVGKDDRKVQFIESSRAEYAKHTLKKSSFITSIPMQVRALMVRRVQIIRGFWLADVIQLA